MTDIAKPFGENTAALFLFSPSAKDKKIFFRGRDKSRNGAVPESL